MKFDRLSNSEMRDFTFLDSLIDNGEDIEHFIKNSNGEDVSISVYNHKVVIKIYQKDDCLIREITYSKEDGYKESIVGMWS